MARPLIGLALGSGGARGWCHIGVLRGLEELGVRPDVVCGCSMGAVVGAAHAGGRLDALEEWALGLTLGRFLKLISVDLAGGGLVDGQVIEDVLAEIGIAGNIEDLPRPFRAVASDMRTGREVWLKEGPVGRLVRASAAIPGVFAPVRHDGRWLMDGGMTNPVPVSLARAMGAEIVIAVNPDAHLSGAVWRGPGAGAAGGAGAGRDPAGSGEGGGLASQISAMLSARFQMLSELVFPPADGGRPGYLSVVNAAVNLMTEEIRRSRLAGDPPHVLLNARIEDLKVLELYRAAEVIEEGRRLVMRHKGEILAALAEA